MLNTTRCDQPPETYGNETLINRQKLAAYFHEALPVLLTACFLSSLIFRGLTGWDYPSAPVQFGALGLVLLSPLRKHLAWQWLALFSFLFFAWVAWRDLSSGAGHRQLTYGLKGLLYCLALLGAASMLNLRQWLQTLSLVIVITLTGVLFYIGQHELMLALHSPLEVASRGIQTPLNRNILAMFLGLLCIWSTSLFLLQPLLRPWLTLPLALLLWGLLLVNAGVGSLVGAMAASLLVLWLTHRRWVFPLLALLGALIITAYAITPEQFNFHRIMNARDVIYLETWPHIINHAWLGAGSEYFQRAISPTLSVGEQPFVHNIYLDFWLAYGLIGAVWLGLLMLCLSRQVNDLLTASGRIIFGGTAAFFLTYGLVDHRPMNPLVFMGLAGMGVVLDSMRRHWANADRDAAPGAGQGAFRRRFYCIEIPGHQPRGKK